MEKPRTTPKDFFLWFGAMLSFYWAVLAFILLIFDYIGYAFPNALSYLPNNPYDTGLGFEMASIVVFLPIYLVLSWLIHRDIARDPLRAEVWVRRWALILTLFLAGAAMAGDLVTLLAAFFSGDELTAAFLLKVLVLLLVAAAVFMHFVADYWGYWRQFPARGRRVGWGAGALAVLTVAAGFMLFGTPSAARQYRFDEQRVGDLQSIQSQVTYYYQQKQQLPASLSQLGSPLQGFVVPMDPQTGVAYEYRATSNLGFELCATFDRASLGSYGTNQAPPGYGGVQDWQHAAGHACFERTIDPAFYPAPRPL